MASVTFNTGTITAASGTGTGTVRLSRFMLRQIIVNPTTSSTTYDVSLTDADSFVIYDAQVLPMDIGALVPNGLRIGRGTSDRFQVEVNDELQTLDSFTVRVMGYRHYP